MESVRVSPSAAAFCSPSVAKIKSRPAKPRRRPARDERGNSSVLRAVLTVTSELPCKRRDTHPAAGRKPWRPSGAVLPGTVNADLALAESPRRTSARGRVWQKRAASGGGATYPWAGVSWRTHVKLPSVEDRSSGPTPATEASAHWNHGNRKNLR